MKFLKLLFFVLFTGLIFFSCQKEYSLETPITAPGSWQFNDSTTLFTGDIDTAYIETTGTTKTLTLLGPSSDGKQIFLLHMSATDSFTVGTYKASLSQSDFQYYTQSKTVYQADQLTGEFVVNITSIGNSKIAGTFSGIAVDSAGKIKQLTKGLFSSAINLSGNGTGSGGTITAVGTLGASAGVCTSTSLSGTYTQGIALTASNTAQIIVNVTTVGTYSITTNNVNGVLFSASGTFTTAGVQNLILSGSGTPTSSGSQTFTVTFGSSTCTFAVTFVAAAPPASGTLGGSPGTCTPATPSGTYTQGLALTSANTLQVQVNVTTPGAYTISTNSVNGVSFTGTGTFIATGVQNVTLAGSGTPTNSGSQSFAVTFGTSTCNFAIIFGAGTLLDYFPTTLNSNWTYGFGTNPTDSLLDKVINYPFTFSGNTYSSITEEQFPITGPADDTLNYRKPGGDYYQYINTQNYFGFDTPGNPVAGEFIFLKDNQPLNTTWNSPNFSGSFSGMTYSLSIKMTIKAKAVTVTVGTLTFNDVIKVTYEYFASGVSIGFIEERWFQRGVGLINYFDNSTTPFVQKIARYTIF